MRNHVCWICMEDFNRESLFIEHESSIPHLELMFKQALGKDHDEVRNRKRRLFAGLEDVRNELGLLDEADDQIWQRKEQSAMSVLQCENCHLLQMTFCRCILNWRMGECSKCAQTPIHYAKLHERIFCNVANAEVLKRERRDRRKTLAGGLRNMYDHDDYDVKKDSKEKQRKFKEPLLIDRFGKFVYHKLFKRFFLPEDMKRKRSPLVPSTVRRKTLKQIHVLGVNVPKPQAVIESPEILNKAARRISQVIINPEKQAMESSPLIPSTERRPTFTSLDRVSTAVQKSGETLRRQSTHMKTELLLRQSSRMPTMRQKTLLNFEVENEERQE